MDLWYVLSIPSDGFPQTAMLIVELVSRTGHQVALTRQKEVGDFDFACTREYGPTYRIGGHLGVRYTTFQSSVGSS